jgi:hypothetical protein
LKKWRKTLLTTGGKNESDVYHFGLHSRRLGISSNLALCSVVVLT